MQIKKAAALAVLVMSLAACGSTPKYTPPVVKKTPPMIIDNEINPDFFGFRDKNMCRNHAWTYWNEMRAKLLPADFEHTPDADKTKANVIDRFNQACLRGVMAKYWGLPSEYIELKKKADDDYNALPKNQQNGEQAVRYLFKKLEAGLYGLGWRFAESSYKDRLK